MKRTLCLILSLLLLLSLTGCLVITPQSVDSEGNGLEIVTQKPGESFAKPSDSAAPPQTNDAQEPVQTTEAQMPLQTTEAQAPVQTTEGQTMLDEDGWYNTKEEVALYIHQYGKLPGNYITKKQAEALGWTGGSLEPYAPGKSIGGSYFGNYEGILPTAKGRKYTECDIDTAGKKSRGAKRIVFSNDGLIYYTDDHYETFELLYGKP